MKAVINDRENLVSEMIEGLVQAYDRRVMQVPGYAAIVKRDIEDQKVALVVGGGSGHEPIYHGLVGENMADAAAIGEIFASPNPEIVFETAKAAQRGNGVLFVYGNYAGDNMNFDVAVEMLDAEGIHTRTVRINDDVATDVLVERRGIAGLLFVVKIAGAVCATTKDLEEAQRITQKAVDNTRSMGVAVRAGVMLNTEKPTFALGEDEIEIGMGLHGEPGVSRTTLESCDTIVDAMMSRILGDLPFETNDEVALLINDLGSITNMELLIVNRRVGRILEERGVRKVHTRIGKFATTMDMKGFSISLIRLDGELKRYFFAGSSSLGFDSYSG